MTVVENQKSIALTANNSKKNMKFISKDKTNKKQGICHFNIIKIIFSVMSA